MTGSSAGVRAPGVQATGPVRVLIADDDASIRAGLEKIIQLEDDLVLVAVAVDADEAIEFARRHQPHVSLLDVNMPGGGGPRAAAGIRAASPRTRVIGHSIHDDRAAVMEMVRAGAVGYVVKGASADEILSTLRRAGLGQSTLSGEVVSTVVQELAGILNEQAQGAEARRAQVAQARRLVAGNGVTMHVDPVIDLVSRVHAGVEASPRLGAEGRSLQEAMESAAAVGYLVELEVALIGLALREVRSLPAGAFLAVQASPATLTSPDFANLDLFSAGFNLVVEVSGRVAAPAYGDIALVLDGVRRRGVRLAVTGLGRSEHAAQHALELRPEILKLDPGLVARLDGDPAEDAVFASAAAFAASVRAELLVGGLVSERQAAAARAAGARMGQGPFVSAAPSPAALAARE